jgi:alpha-L-fucosidase
MRGACISKVTSNTSISNVELLGHKAPLQWNQGEIGLKIQLPGEKPCDHAIVFKINGLEQK